MKKYHGETIEERKAITEAQLPALFKNSYGISTMLLKTSLFSSAVRGPRKSYADYTELHATSGIRLLFSGEELRQDDLQVLLALLKENSGKTANTYIYFHARAFCRDVLGWADSSDSAAKLKASIERLLRASVQVADKAGNFWYSSFVCNASLQAGGEWSVSLDTSIANLMRTHLTYLSVADFALLARGLESWLYAFVRADACYAPFRREELQRLSGCTYDAKNFNRHLKRILEAFVNVGVIKGFSFDKENRVLIQKFSKASA